MKPRTLPSGTVIWLGRWRDPETGKEREISLDGLRITSAEGRRAWALEKANEVAEVRRRLSVGQAEEPEPVAPTALEDAINTYLESSGPTLRPKTVATYGLALANLREWARARGVASLDDLTRARLVDLRDYLVALPKRGSAKGAPRGSTKAGGRRSPLSVNRDLRALKTILGSWRRRELLQVTRDDILDALGGVQVQHDPPTYYSATELARLIEAAVRHDLETFDQTRDEHAGRRPKGSTARYSPIGPFLAAALLTGARRGELLALTWEMVDLDAVDHEGRKVGEIRLPSEVVKTHRGRTIGLEVSPMLRRILAATKLRDGAEGHVFGGARPYTGDLVEAARRRLVKEYGAPAFDWQGLRSTCATYLTGSQSIFGSATVFLSARQLGHSVAVAERHYLGTHRGIPKDARTLEAAMQIEKPLADLLGAIVTAPRPKAVEA